MNERTARRAPVAILAAAVSCLLAHPADARSWSATGPRGGTWNRTVSPFSNGGGNFGRTVTTTRPNGATATSNFSRSVSNGTITDMKTVTGFNGATRSGTLTRTPGEGRTATYTGPGGQTYSAATTRFANGDGNFGRTRTVSGPLGTTTRQFSQTDNGNGTFTDTRTLTTPDGETHTASRTRP